jgi:hypothetical protein
MNRQPFPSRAPIGVIFAGMLALVAVIPCAAIWKSVLGPVRAFYLSDYLSVSTSGKPHEYVLLTKARRLSGPPLACLASTPALVSAGAGEDVKTVGRCVTVITPTQMKGWLRTAVYGGQSEAELVRLPVLAWILAAAFLLIAGGRYDWRRKQRARIGVQVRGPELVSRWEFNRRVKGDGFPIALENRSNLFERMRGERGKVLRIRRGDENKNIICMSDPGGGKTSILMQILDEVQRRG